MKTSKKLNVLIIEAYTDANIGSGALVENSIDVLKKNFPDAAIRVMAHYPKAFVELCGVESVPDIFNYPYGMNRLKQRCWLLTTLLWMVIIIAESFVFKNGQFPLFREKVKDFMWADVVVSVGAERINDKFVKNIIFSLYTYHLVKRLGRKLVLFPCTIGPFLYSWTKALTSMVLRSADLVFTRDNLSEQNSIGLGIPSDVVVNTSDVAVNQKMVGRSESRRKLDVADSDKIVGISVMRWTYVSNRVETPFSNYASYLEEMTKLADAIIEKYGVVVAFFPTNYPVRGCREDDVSTAREIIARMKHRDQTRLVDTLPTPSELMGMLACSEINITTRMHACILSTDSGTPTISVNYLFKLKEYMDSIGLEKFTIDIEEFNADWTLRTFDSMWPEREYWRKVISNNIERKQLHLLSSMERLNALLR